MKKLILILVLALGVTFANGQNAKNPAKAKTTKSVMPVKTNMVKITEFPISNLQARIFANIMEFYPDYFIVGAYGIENICHTPVIFKVKLEKGQSEVDLFYDKNGQFLRTDAFPKVMPASTYMLNKWFWGYHLNSADKKHSGC
jgi:hypothetical protein